LLPFLRLLLGRECAAASEGSARYIAIPLKEPDYPGAVAPEHRRFFVSDGARLRVDEWGDPSAAPLVLLHGGFDHGRGFDTLAPLLAARFHVLALTSRGHGDSSWDDSYAWPNDIADTVNLLRSLGRKAHLVGHSRGGGQATDATLWAPECVRQLVNIDGFGPPPEGFTPIGGIPNDGRSLPLRFREHLDRRRKAAQRAWRPYPSFEDLVERRRAQNPRLSREWLRYFLFHGAREVEGGWVWKVDPEFGGGFGPWRPEWIAPRWKHLQVPMLAIVGSEPDIWQLEERFLAERLSYVPELTRASVAGAGHFVHMERPRETADSLLGWLER
jgi:pimeloyl-ACP methyl ester carboxylesterase